VVCHFIFYAYIYCFSFYASTYHFTFLEDFDFLGIKALTKMKLRAQYKCSLKEEVLTYSRRRSSFARAITDNRVVSMLGDVNAHYQRLDCLQPTEACQTS